MSDIKYKVFYWPPQQHFVIKITEQLLALDSASNERILYFNLKYDTLDAELEQFGEAKEYEFDASIEISTLHYYLNYYGRSFIQCCLYLQKEHERTRRASVSVLGSLECAEDDLNPAIKNLANFERVEEFLAYLEKEKPPYFIHKGIRQEFNTSLRKYVSIMKLLWCPEGAGAGGINSMGAAYQSFLLKLDEQAKNDVRTKVKEAKEKLLQILSNHNKFDAVYAENKALLLAIVGENEHDARSNLMRLQQEYDAYLLRNQNDHLEGIIKILGADITDEVKSVSTLLNFLNNEQLRYQRKQVVQNGGALSEKIISWLKAEKTAIDTALSQSQIQDIQSASNQTLLEKKLFIISCMTFISSAALLTQEIVAELQNKISETTVFGKKEKSELLDVLTKIYCDADLPHTNEAFNQIKVSLVSLSDNSGISVKLAYA